MPIRAIIVHNPFDRSNQEVKNLEYRGQSLAELKDEHLPKNLDVNISVNGLLIEKLFWCTTKPQLGDEIVFMPIVSGGGGGDKDILGAVLTIALVIAVGPAGLDLFAAGAGLGSYAAGVALIVGGGMLINSLMPAPAFDSPNFDFETSQTYRWNPQTTQRQGLPKPKFYGRNKLFGNVISVYTEPDAGDDTKQLINMLVALGTGPVKGITKSDGSNLDININSQAIQNYDDITVEEKTGEIDQTAVSLFSDTKPEYRPNRLVTNSGGPEIYTTPDNDFDDLEIELLFDRGIYEANNQGGLSNHSIDIKIEISVADAASWFTLVDTTITAASTGAIRKNFIATESYTGGSPVTIDQDTKYDIRVTKDTSDIADAKFGDRMLLGSIREVMTDAFQYPGLSLLAIKALATDQLSGGLEISVIQEGAIVAVYDGGWTLEYSTNPAWVLYDILSQPIISGDGDGTPYAVERYEGMNPSKLPIASFAALATFCDELVTDGKGGTEKRITFNGGFDVGTTMWEAALKVCEIARCIPVWDGSSIRVAIDKATTATQLFNVSNIKENSFKRTFMPQSERASEIEIHYRDEEQDFKRVPFSIINPDAGSIENKITLELFGITKQTEAFRAGMFRLFQNALLTSAIEFEADIDSISSTIGDVINVQHDVPNWNAGGRIISSTNDTITVDKPMIETGGVDKVLIRVVNTNTGDEDIETHTVSSISGSGLVITITDTWTTNPMAKDLYWFGSSEEVLRRYRITELSRGQDQRLKIHAVQYDVNVYDSDNDDPVIPISDYTAPSAAGDLANRPPTFDEIRREYPKNVGRIPTMDVPITTNLIWSGNTVDTVSWAKEIGADPILLTYKGITYEITPGSTTNKYIYWDLNSNPTTFNTTGTLSNVIGNDKWLMCLNEDGVASPAWTKKIIHGGMIQADTITANEIIVTGLDVLVMTNAPAEANADNTSSNETFSQESDINVLQTTNAPAAAGADVTGDNQGDVNIDNIADGSSFKKMRADWQAGGDVTKIDGGKIFTNTVVANAINVTNLAAINADLGTITAGNMSAARLTTGLLIAARVDQTTINLILSELAIPIGNIVGELIDNFEFFDDEGGHRIGQALALPGNSALFGTAIAWNTDEANNHGWVNFSIKIKKDNVTFATYEITSNNQYKDTPDVVTINEVDLDEGVYTIWIEASDWDDAHGLQEQVIQVSVSGSAKSQEQVTKA